MTIATITSMSEKPRSFSDAARIRVRKAFIVPPPGLMQSAGVLLRKCGALRERRPARSDSG
ncbi:hypothetical protein GCM10027057_11100 [Marisediminicola antarctica]